MALYWVTFGPPAVSMHNGAKTAREALRLVRWAWNDFDEKATVKAPDGRTFTAEEFERLVEAGAFGDEGSEADWH
jgi:hypothetical protein